MRKLVALVALWVATVTGIAVPELLRTIPRGVVARCTSLCELAPAGASRGRTTLAQATIVLRDGRVLELGEGDFPCECSCRETARTPSWCVPVGGFVEKRRWEVGIRTTEGLIGSPATLVLGLSASWIGTMLALVLALGEGRRTTALYAAHPAGRWLSAGLASLQAALHYPLLPGVILLMIAGVRHPLPFAVAGVPWLAAFALVRWSAARGGSRRLLLFSARRIARHRPGGAVLVGRLDGDALALRSGEVVVLDVASVVWLGDRPADGATVEVVAALEATGMEARRLVRTVVPLDGRPPLGRVTRG